MEFKDMLKYYRQNMGLSQRELAARLKLSPSTISMYEVGNREPDFETEEKIADFFNVDLNTLRGKDTEATPAPAAAPSLSSDRIDLLEKYDVLNDEGKAEAVRYISMLGSVPTYTEEHADTKLNA